MRKLKLPNTVNYNSLGQVACVTTVDFVSLTKPLQIYILQRMCLEGRFEVENMFVACSEDANLSRCSTPLGGSS